MDANEILARYAVGEREFSGVDLIRTNLRGAYLRGANLRGANLMGANLMGANLMGANLSEVNLREAELAHTCLRGANLSCAELSNSDLSNALLLESNLVNANLSNANLSNAELSGSIMIATNLTRCNLRQSALMFVNLSGSNLSNAILIDINLTGANLCYANLMGANLSGANLDEINLWQANLSRANLSGVNLSKTNLWEANLSEANLSGANLSGANLSGANLSGANLLETVFTDTLLSGAKLDKTILTYQKTSEELQRENQELREKLSLLETQFEKCVEKEIQRKLIVNQGIKANKLTWQGLRFRSEPEKKNAQALDEMGILFFPLPSVRVMTEEGMITREVDFLICSKGIWGILECDGEMWHLSAAKDHRRDNDFKRHGLWFIQRFTDKECKKNPYNVVRQFLDMLHKFHEDQRYLIIGESAERESSRLPNNSSPQTEKSSHQSNSNLSELTIDIEGFSHDEEEIPF